MEPNAPNAVNNVNNPTPVSSKPPIKPKTGCLGTAMILSLIFILLLIIFIPGCVKYNGLVKKENALKARWSDVENLFQYRASLFNNLPDIVDTSAQLERTTLVEVQDARSKATSVSVTSDNLDQSIQNEQNFQTAFSRLLAVNENYPTLNFPAQYTDLMNNIIAIEDSIRRVKKTFNDAALEYNNYRETFPGNFYGWMFGFEESYLKFDITGEDFLDKYLPEKDPYDNKKLYKK